MTTYTWGVQPTGNFNTPVAWRATDNSGTPSNIFNGMNDYVVNSSSVFAIGWGGNGGFSVNSLLFNNPNASVSQTSTTATGALAGLTVVAGLTLTAGSYSLAPTGRSQTSSIDNLTVNGGLFNIGNGSAGTAIANIGTTVTLSALGSIAVGSKGELDIGTTSGAVGQVTIASTGTLNISNTGGAGTLSASSFNMSGGTFSQSGGTVNITNTATFTGGTDTMTGGNFTAAGVTFGTPTSSAFALNGGTLSSSAGAIVTTGNELSLAGGTLNVTSGAIANSGTLIGNGKVVGTFAAGGVNTASGGTLDINSGQNAGSFTVAAGAVLQFDNAASGGTVTYATAGSGAIEFSTTAASQGFTDVIANLGTAASASSVSGDNFINIAANIGTIKVGASGHQFNGSFTTFTVFGTDNVTSLGTFTLASAPGATTFVDWGLDSSVGGGVGSGTDIFLSNVICYATGTLIQTDRGEVPVESLQAGDGIVTLQDGQPVIMPVKWMGIRTIDLTAAPNPHVVCPIRIRAGAFGDGLPRRDLLVSPAHALYADGMLVPANLLINHMTITQELHAKTVTYHHVELEKHALILAEGLVSESFLDTGNRAFFSNAGLALVLHPEFHINAGLKVWEEDACAPLAVDAETIAPIWRELADRAEAMGHVPPRFTTTQEADLYIEADGRRLRPIAVANGRHTFALPAGAGEIRLHSRTSAPADLNPLLGDWRPLGVAVRGMTVRTADDHIVIPADHPALTEGWHTPETGNGSVWRWTAGNAAIPMPGTTGPAMLDIDIGAMATYIVARSDREQRLAA